MQDSRVCGDYAADGLKLAVREHGGDGGVENGRDCWDEFGE